MKQRLIGIYYSFPVQLLVMHAKHNFLLLCLWAMLFALVSGGFGKSMGFHYFFLDPEYFNVVGFWSFYVVGVTFGVFYIAWNTTTYILNSYRFPFLASLDRPFAKYSFNNFLLPFIFVVYYLYQIVNFQWYNEFAEEYSIIFYILGILAGLITTLMVSMLYFYLTNKDIAAYRKVNPLKISKVLQAVVVRHREREMELAKDNPYKDAWRVDYYLTESLRPRIVRSVRHYNFELLERVFRQNHANALVIQSLSIASFILMGAFVEYPYFRIPTGGSMLLLFSIISTVVGALTYWMKEWKTVFLIVVIVSLDKMMGLGWFYYENKAYGLNYAERATYSYAVLDSICSKEQYKKDVKQTLDILENWREQFGRTRLLRKPKLVVICASGGGLRAGVWAMKSLQEIDKALNGKLLKHTVLMTGASGGMLGTAYYRELYHQKKLGKKIDPNAQHYLDNMSKDLANALAFTFLVNDIFIPWVNINVNGYKYKQDRGYIFEQQYIENTEGLMDMDLDYYREPEQKAIIPMMFLTPFITNDGRMMFISPHPLSYMMKPPFIYQGAGDGDFAEIDGVDFAALFSKQDPYNMRFSTALRMSATYPFIFPNVHMPSEPTLEVMDAGFRDNFGLESATRFLAIFRTWIRENTSGVTIISLRGYEKIGELPKKTTHSFINSFFNPISTVLEVDLLQDYHHDNYIAYLKSKLGYDKVDLVRFVYKPTTLEERASLSLHLTEREIIDISEAMKLEENQKSLSRLKELVK